LIESQGAFAGLAGSGEAPGHVPGAFLCRGRHADDHDGFVELAYALHLARGAWPGLKKQKVSPKVFV
jgi:hypothetical protein